MSESSAPFLVRLGDAEGEDDELTAVGDGVEAWSNRHKWGHGFG